MIKKIIKKIRGGERPDTHEILALFHITRDEDLASLSRAAFLIKKEHGKSIKLTSTVHLTNQCQVTPKCHYCGFAAGTSPSGYFHPFFKTDDEIREAVMNIGRSGIPRVSCSGAHGYGGRQAVNAARIVKENSSLELLINVGSDLTKESVASLARYGTDTVCCNLETVNRSIFHAIKPGETLDRRINACRMISDNGIELSSGLLIGIGESCEDRVRHLDYLSAFDTLGEIPIMGFNPYAGTPMENHPPCSLKEQIKTIAITRILYPEIRITVPTPTIGPENLKYPLLAGADNVATVIPDQYPLPIKGVGSPAFGTLAGVLKVIRDLGLDPQITRQEIRHDAGLPTLS